MPVGASASATAGSRGAFRTRVVSWGTRRPTAVAAALYLLLSLIMFSPGLVPGRTLSASDLLWTATPWDSSRPASIPPLGSNRELTDSVAEFQPALLATRASLPHIPLWDPDTLSGRPLIADPQAAVFSPFSVPAYVLPFWKSLAVIAALKLFVAALGAFLLGRLLGMRFGGALLTGLVFGFSLWSVTWVSWPHMSVWAFLPWLCLLSERCVRRPGPLPFVGLAIVVGLQFLAGHPSSSYQILLVVGLFWVARVVLSAPLRRRFALRLLVLAFALVAGAAVAALVLLPFAELLAHSQDTGLRAQLASLFHEPTRDLLGIFLHDYWGHGPTSLEFASELEEHAYYVAALPLMLAAGALVGRPRRERIAVAAVGATTLAVATGISPMYDLAVKLPGLAAANNGRFAVVSVLCLAVLAGWGLDDLTGSRLRPSRRRAVIAVSVALLAAPVVIVAGSIHLDAFGSALSVAWGFATPTRKLASPAGGGISGLIHLASLLEWLVVATAALVLLMLRLRGRLGTAAFVGLATLLVAADLFRAGMGYNPAIPLSHATQPATGAIRFLQAQRPARFAGLTPLAPVSLIVPLPPNTAMRYGLYDTRGYVIPTEERYHEIWRRVIAPSSNCLPAFCTAVADTTPRALHALGLLGVTDLLQNRRDPPLSGRGFRLAYQGPDARIYANPAALPRAFLVDQQLVVPGASAALATVASPRFPARSVVATEQPLPGLAPATGARAAAPGVARISRYDPERVVVDTSASHPSLLILTDTWFPGWHATVDGAPAPIHRVDYLIRGVPVPAGAHRIEFRYDPASWTAGWIISLATLLALATTAAIGWRRQRARIDDGERHQPPAGDQPNQAKGI